MRRIVFLLLATACARPVLYYPTPESAGIRPDAADTSVNATPAASNPAPKPTSSAPRKTASETSGDTDSRVPLMIGAGGTAGAGITRADDEAYLLDRHIMVPVAGADMTRVEDSFNEARDGGERTHRAIDILAPRGTPILSADDGRILRMSKSTLGGISMYVVDTDARLVYYYAHMQGYHKKRKPGGMVSRGDTLGYVGTTGNAPKNLPHLHFQVMRFPLDGKYWDGEAIDPYEALGGIPRSAGGSSSRR